MKIISTGYSKSAMQEAFSVADHNEKKSDRVAQLIDETNSEEELLERLEQMKVNQE